MHKNCRCNSSGSESVKKSVIVMKEALVRQHPWLLPGRSCRQSALRNRLVTEEECGQKLKSQYDFQTSTQV